MLGNENNEYQFRTLISTVNKPKKNIVVSALLDSPGIEVIVRKNKNASSNATY